MTFEVFKRRARPFVSDPVVGIQSRGTISLNAAAYNLLKGGCDVEELYAELLFDLEKKIVGIRAVEKGAPNSYIVRKQKHAESYLITAKAFVSYYGIELREARHYSLKNFGDGIVGFSLENDLKS